MRVGLGLSLGLLVVGAVVVAAQRGDQVVPLRLDAATGAWRALGAPLSSRTALEVA